jgi:hypothetical protein
MLFGFGVVSIDSNFTLLSRLNLRRCVKFVVILPLGSGYPSFIKPFGKSVRTWRLSQAEGGLVPGNIYFRVSYDVVEQTTSAQPLTATHS